jgi:Rrf2 family protein
VAARIYSHRGSIRRATAADALAKAKYALRALLVLAARPDDEPVHIADIAEVEHISGKFLEATLLELRKHGVLASQRGQHGGYRLARPASEISFGEVIRIIDGPLALLPCASVTAFLAARLLRCGQADTDCHSPLPSRAAGARRLS